MHLVREAPYFTRGKAGSVDEFYEANHFLRARGPCKFNLGKFENVENITAPEPILPGSPHKLRRWNQSQTVTPIFEKSNIIQTCCTEWHTSNASRYGSCYL